MPNTKYLGQNFKDEVVEETQGQLSVADNSSISTNLAAWNETKKILDRGEAGGSLFTNPIGSTYSLVYTAFNAYYGGILAPNGDIHFVPYNANRGQKISAAGVVSTYSLVYTAAAAYEGCVLAPNGDIHFIPASANRGQKISVTGVVSTYSLVYTTASAYSGGVLAPNGDIHFVPRSAIVGQKISRNVVSTYSLAPGAYAGGVLTPNGDIHFIPFSAGTGQKINAISGINFDIGTCIHPHFNKF